jgi:hypothetical protein
VKHREERKTLQGLATLRSLTRTNPIQSKSKRPAFGEEKMCRAFPRCGGVLVTGDYRDIAKDEKHSKRVSVVADYIERL